MQVISTYDLGPRRDTRLPQGMTPGHLKTPAKDGAAVKELKARINVQINFVQTNVRELNRFISPTRQQGTITDQDISLALIHLRHGSQSLTRILQYAQNVGGLSVLPDATTSDVAAIQFQLTELSEELVSYLLHNHPQNQQAQATAQNLRRQLA